MSPAAKTKTRLGAHTPTSGGMVKRSLGYAQTIGADAIQIFASNPRGWALSTPNPEADEEFRTKALKAVDMYLKAPAEDRKPCMFVLDSLGMLSTTKEITDALNEKEVRDMTKSQLIKGAFRMLTLKLGQANVPLIVTNHTYDVIGAYVPTKEMGGGSGLKYAASTIIYLSKKKEKDGTEVVGNIIKAKTAKSRLSKENKDVEIRLFYDERGLDRYYGLLELGEIGGLWKNVAGRYEIDGKKIYAKQILKEPEVYFTEEVMQQLDEIARKEFSYGEGSVSNS